MLCFDAFVSGSLHLTLFRRDKEGDWDALDEPDGAPRAAKPNDVFLMRAVAREQVPVDPEGMPVQLSVVRERFREEIRFFDGLDGLLVGMDFEMSDKIRKSAIRRADGVLAAKDDTAARIRARFLVNASSNNWDFKGALAFAKSMDSTHAASLYQPLASGCVLQVEDDIASAISTRFGKGARGASIENSIRRSGLAAELIVGQSTSDINRLRQLPFQEAEFSRRGGTPIGTPLIIALVSTVLSRLEQTVQAPVPQREKTGTEPGYEIDPILAAIESAHASIAARRQSPGTRGDLPAIRRAIRWIGNLIGADQIESAERAIIKLIVRQGQRSMMKHVAMTVTSVASHAIRSYQFDFADRLLRGLDYVGFEDAATVNCRVQWYRKQGRHNEAFMFAQDGLDRYSYARVLWLSVARVLREQAKYSEALVHCERMISRFPDDVYGYIAMARCFWDLGRQTDAYAHITDSISRFPRSAVLRNIEVGFLREEGRLTDAVGKAHLTHKLFPDNDYAIAVLAQSLFDAKRHEDALRLLIGATVSLPDNKVFRNMYAGYLRKLGRSNEALASLRDTIRLFPDDPVSRNQYSQLLFETGKRHEALAYALETVRRFPTDPAARNVYVLILIDNGNYEDALTHLRKGTKNKRVAATVSDKQTTVAGHLSYLDDALSHLEQAMLQFPDDTYSRGIYATALQSAGDPIRALNHLRSEIGRLPGSVVLRNTYASLLIECDQADSAEEVLYETIERFPNDTVAPGILASIN